MFSSNDKQPNMRAKKNSEADLNTTRKRIGYTTVGLIAALSITLLGFEWRKGEIALPELQTFNKESLGGETVTDHGLRPPKAPEPPKPPPPVKPPVDSFIIVADTAIESDVTFAFSLDSIIEWSEPEPEIVLDNNRGEPVKTVSRKAEYECGGEKEIKDWLSQNISYPQIAAYANMEGRVFVQFVVEMDGSISNVKAIGKVPHPSLAKEAVDKVKKLPCLWKPGELNGVEVRSYFKLPVLFRLN